MKQYNSLKSKVGDAILLFRVGDFYETFGADAIRASKVLGITLTKRSNGSASEVELAGFPYHSLNTYLPKFAASGMRVAICEQTEDPKKTKVLVKREITEIISPGTILDSTSLTQNRSNYLCAIHKVVRNQEEHWGIALLELSTGEFLTSEGDAGFVRKVFEGAQPAEILISKADRDDMIATLGEEHSYYPLEEWLWTDEYCRNLLVQLMGTQNLKGFGIEDWSLGVIAAGIIVHYLEQNKQRSLEHIRPIAKIENDEFLWLDAFTLRNLEILHSQSGNEHTLIYLLDHCVTPMGSRLLWKWVGMPLRSRLAIEKRLESVDFLKQERSFRESLRQMLKQVGDLERLVVRINLQKSNPRDIIALRRALSQIDGIRTACTMVSQVGIANNAALLNPCGVLQQQIALTIDDDAPAQMQKGGVIRKGVHKELDEWKDMSANSKEYLLQIQRRETERTGITSLKIGFNQVFGYYLEVTHTHKDKVPAEWIRKQTLTGAERYITPELKDYEEKIMKAEEVILTLEKEVYDSLLLDVAKYLVINQENSRILAEIDCLVSLAEVADEMNYCRPILDDGYSIQITEGRHPVIEKNMDYGESYIPNSIALDREEQQLIVITGPNMSGKSAILRQTALIALMAHIGSFVPASEAHIGLLDKIFTRVGASDNLSRGESTFMVEMTESANILNNLTSRSLIILDEIGRGTATYDGISLAWAITEYLHNHPTRPKTLFATHYHELNDCSNTLPRVKNFHVKVREMGKKIIFLRTLEQGGSEHSFGIHVARMAGVPELVVSRAEEVLDLLESQRNSEGGAQIASSISNSSPVSSDLQLRLFDYGDPLAVRIKEEIDKVDIDRLSPMEALLKLAQLKDLLKKRK